MPSGFTWTIDTLTPGLRRLPKVTHDRLGIFMDFQSAKVQDHMRMNAPWTDRTSNARNGLFAKSVNTPLTFSIVCYHTVPYGIYLEVKNDGKYAIIVPTIIEEGQRIMGALNGLLTKATL